MPTAIVKCGVQCGVGPPCTGLDPSVVYSQVASGMLLNPFASFEPFPKFSVVDGQGDLIYSTWYAIRA